jgi:1-acyl-sn-glycerol-3-phosphate acyltransferase
MKIWYGFVYMFLKIFYGLLHPVRVIGREHIPQGAAIICGNHTSMADPLFMVFGLRIQNNVQPMAKIEVMRVPVVGFVLKKAGVFGVDRGNNDVGAVKHAFKVLKEGGRLVMFPEGTRVKVKGEKRIKTGAAMFAVKTGAPLFPVYISPKRGIFKRTLVVFGPAYHPDYDKSSVTQEDYQVIANDLMERIYALGAQHGD